MAAKDRTSERRGHQARGIFAPNHSKGMATKGGVRQDDRADEIGRKGNDGRDWKAEGKASKVAEHV